MVYMAWDPMGAANKDGREEDLSLSKQSDIKQIQ